MKTANADVEIRFRPRETVEFSFPIPKDVLASLERVAVEKETTVEALMRTYVGAGLRDDLGLLFGARVLASVERVLAEHLADSAEVAAIVEELRLAAVDPSHTWIKNPQ